MTSFVNDDHEALRESARAFLDKEVNLAPLLVPGADVTAAGHDRLWGKIVDMGWPGMVTPEAYGGLGLNYLDLTMVVGELGRTLAPSYLFGTLAGAWAIERAGSEEQKETLLGQMAEGKLKLALAVADPDGRYDHPASDAVATNTPDGWRISGQRGFVVDGLSADKLVVAASVEDERRFFVVDRAAAGVRASPVDWRDITRQMASVSFDGAAGELLHGGNAEVWPWVRDRLYLLLATESEAVARFALDDAVAYAKERIAFGRPIGAFQAIKHQLAEIAGQVECAQAAVQHAAWALSENDPRAPLACAMAQSYASEAARDATYRNLQIFGAIAFSWEMRNHLYYKRARANFALLGDPSQQREELVQFLEREAA